MNTSLLGKLTQRIRSVAQPQAQSDPAISLELAAAALLVEVAYADSVVSDSELAAIRRAIQSQFELDEQTIDQLLEDSVSAHEHSVGVQSFTRALTDHWDEAQRFELVVALWKVAGAEAGVHAFEEHRIRGIADLLYLSHSRFIEAKLRAKRGAPDQ